MREILNFAKGLVSSRKMLLDLAKNDLKARFAASFLGVIWAFMQPLITILVFWYVFQVGFRNPPVDDIQFILWFIPAYLSWTFFTEALTATSTSIMEYSYLVKKVNFRVSIIPIVKIMSSTIVHLAFIVFIFVMFALYGHPFSIYNLQVFYYLFCMIVLLLGLGWLLSAIAPFVKDTLNLINVAIQMGFWMTPIFWNPATMDAGVIRLLKLNPMYYICDGYRDCFIYHIWFWEKGKINIAFWGITLIIFVMGIIVFKRLRPYFADEL